jgi:multiple sugar transport system ATP-binding protein
VYADPQTVFVAAFLGTPRTNLLEGAVHAADGHALIDLGSQVLELPPGDPRRALVAGHHTRRVTVALRADALTPAAPDAGGVLLRGTVRLVENLGHETLVHLDTGGVRTSVEASRMELPQAEHRLADLFDEPVPRLIPRQRRGGQPPRTARTTYGFYPVWDPDLPGDPPPAGEVVMRLPGVHRPAPGTPMTLAVDLDRLLLFDSGGRRIRPGRVSGVS